MENKLKVLELSGKKKLIYDEVKKIYEIDKKISPSKVLEQAKDKNHPLHSFFEWNDEIASNKYRLIQARELINGIIIQIMNEEKDQKYKVRAFFSVSENENNQLLINGNKYSENYFVSLEDIDKDEQLIKYQKLKAKAELKVFQVKYAFLSNYLGTIFSEIDKLK